MKRNMLPLLLSVLVSASISVLPAAADETTTFSSGVGFKGANKFAPKYKERIKTYREQIQMGLTKGWLTQAQGDHFSSELNRLAELEEKVAQTNYAQPGLDDVEKQFTTFNIEFSRAASSPAPAAAPAKPATPSATTPSTSATTPKATTTAKTTSTSKTTTTKKAPSKPATKPAAKGK